MPAFAYHFGPVNIYSDVYAGGGNSSSPINEFDPVNKEIFAGETIKWSNPTAGAPYPHIVAFISNQSTELKSKISNITKQLQTSNLQSVISNLNKLTMENDNENNRTVQTFSARSIIFPSVINSSNLSVTYLNASENQLFKAAEYNMTGNETFLNSGIIWAGGVIPGKFAKINSFIVTFMNPGTYHYQCLIYPDMKGTIIVKPNPGKLGIQIK
jgi:plastocyanin